jgi:hypothetical protein
MGILKNGKFWGGVVTGVILYYVYANHMKGRVGG